MTGKEFKTKREELGLSQSELAELMSVTRVTISRWENSKIIPKAQASAICTLYHNDTDKMYHQPEIKNEVNEETIKTKKELREHFEKLLKKVNKTIEKLEKEASSIDALKELNEFIILKKDIQKELDSI